MIVYIGHNPIHSKGKHLLPLVFLERLSRHFADSNTNYLSYNNMCLRMDSQ